MSPKPSLLPSLSLIFSVLMVCFLPVHAQTVHEITSEFEVSGSSQLYAGAMGVAPVDVDGHSRILIAWHKAPVPGGGVETSDGEIEPLEFQKGVFVSFYSPSGVALQETIRVDEPDTEGWPIGPILAADAEGRFVVVWRQANSIWMRPFDAEGLPIRVAERLADETDALPSIDMNKNGEFVVVLGRTEPKNDMNFDTEKPQFWSYDANFQITHEQPHLVDETLSTPPYSLNSAVSLNDSGNLAIAYSDSTPWAFLRTRYLRLRTMTSDGRPISTPIEVESSTVWGMNIEWLDEDSFVVSWMDGGRYAPVIGKWQVFSKDGQILSQLFSTDTAVGQGGVLKISETEVAVAWATESGPFLISSTLDEQSEAIPLNIDHEVLPGSYVDYSVGDFSGWPVAYPLVVTMVNDDHFAGVWMNKLDHREQVRAGIYQLKPEDDMALIMSEIAGPCVENKTATVKISWVSDLDQVEIHVAGPSADKLFAKASGSGELLTGLWARHGMAFQLVNPQSGDILATAKAKPSSETCPLSPVLTDPRVIEVCDPRELSATEVLWDITGTPLNGVEIRVNGIEGKLFARGGQLGSALTGDWLRNDTVFYLLIPGTSELLGTASTEYQQLACN